MQPAQFSSRAAAAGIHHGWVGGRSKAAPWWADVAAAVAQDGSLGAGGCEVPAAAARALAHR